MIEPENDWWNRLKLEMEREEKEGVKKDKSKRDIKWNSLEHHGREVL